MYKFLLEILFDSWFLMEFFGNIIVLNVIFIIKNMIYLFVIIEKRVIGMNEIVWSKKKLIMICIWCFL